MKKLLLTLLVITAPLFAHADLLWYEGFNYPDGCITNNSAGLWVKTSGTANPSDMFVKNKKVEISATGSTVSSRQDDYYRRVTITNGGPYTNAGQVIYASFTVICTNLPNGAGSYFAGFFGTAASGGGFFGRIQALTNGTVVPNTWRLGISANASATATKVYARDLALNTPYQVVARWDALGVGGATVWINPIDETDPSAISSDGIGAGNTNSINAFALRQASTFGNSFFQLTNLDMATTFTDAATNIWATNAVSPVIAYQPKGTTNFVGVPISLTAVAAGQGQANLTYQWRTNGVNISNPDGNTNILNLSSPVASDSADYTLVVTTPFGLSVTSSVAKVLVSSAPVPPSFTSQPVSQTVYKGQSVTFSTTVISPGNVFYQWFSNNIALPGETASVLTLVNVQTNITGSTYKVAVTNDYINPPTNGIVSSNAVLTVLNPQSVSIAYLRSLVDSSTFLPTPPATQPFQVTGVVTTYTNTTTGDTASYFLQDATAGINIFATFGSTFRPQLGDVVTFVGVLSSFSTTGLEMFADTVNRAYTSYSIISNSYPLPTARIIPYALTNTYGYAYVATNIAGSLVTLTNVYFGTNTGNTVSTTANQAITVTNSSGQTFRLQFFNLDQNTAGQTLPAFATTVTGVLYGFHPSYSVAISKFSDIVAPPVAPPTMGFSLAGNVLTFSWAATGFNLQSQTNSLSVGLQTNNWINYPDPSNPVNVTIDPANPTVFYRLFKP